MPISLDPGKVRTLDVEQPPGLEQPVEFLHHLIGGRQMFEHVGTVDGVGITFRKGVGKAEQIVIDVALILLRGKADHATVNANRPGQLASAAADIEQDFAGHLAQEPLAGSSGIRE